MYFLLNHGDFPASHVMLNHADKWGADSSRMLNRKANEKPAHNFFVPGYHSDRKLQKITMQTFRSRIPVLHLNVRMTALLGGFHK